MSLLVGDKLIVSMHYKLTDNDGNVIDSSEGAEPLAYLHGGGQIIPGLENALTGKTEGSSLQVKIEPADGYGEVNPELLNVVKKEVFQGVDSIEPGMQFEAQTPEGGMQRIVVQKVEGDDVTIDANHPLAGMALNFDVNVVGVRDATEEELSHGHAH
jgi:FKBP-type peptidyl-prolyl cis-trans isomerase SlyD